MARLRRSPNAEAPAKIDDSAAPLLSPIRRLLHKDEIPPWYQNNDYIYTGYRPASRSIRQCLYSLTYVHNETANIYSHLIPAVAALLGNIALAEYFAVYFPRASWADQAIIHIYLTTSVCCFAMSSVYHTLLCHSSQFYDLWGRLDYVAIVFQILGSFISGIYVGFYCEPKLQTTYWTMIGTLGLLTGLVVLHPRLQGREWRILRLLAFVITGFSAFAPIIHAASIFPYEQLDKQAGLRYYYLEGLLLLIGVALYATNFPESWKPGKFDIWGASHQIFHIMVVLGAMVHLYGILAAYKWNYENARC